MTKKQIGKLGEDVACIYLKKQGFSIIEINFQRKWGEIDIVAEKEGRICFVEVKSVTLAPEVIHETHGGEHGGHRPEDNINPWKLRKLSRIIQTYLQVYGAVDIQWDFVAVIVKLNLNSRLARVYTIKDIIV